MKGFTAPNVSVRRRYQDFRWLYNALNRDYPERVLPPLPDKHRLGMCFQFIAECRLLTRAQRCTWQDELTQSL